MMADRKDEYYMAQPYIDVIHGVWLERLMLTVIHPTHQFLYRHVIVCEYYPNLSVHHISMTGHVKLYID